MTDTKRIYPSIWSDIDGLNTISDDLRESISSSVAMHLMPLTSAKRVPRLKKHVSDRSLGSLNDLEGDGVMTEMACDDMQTEDALRRILPDIAAIDVENDSIVRLNCRNHSGYIILRKNTAHEVK